MQVEDQLFRVHCYFLAQESSSFANLLRSLDPKSSGPRGVTDDTAIVIPDVTAKEFETLLDFFYKGFVFFLPFKVEILFETNIIPHRMHYGFKFELDNWITLLSISTRLEFEAIRKRAIQEINDADKNILSPIDKIVLAAQHNVPEWLAPAYGDLCRRDEPLEEAEAVKIGYRKTVLLARAREALRDDSWVRVPMKGPPIFPPESPSPDYPQNYSRRRSLTPEPIQRSRFNDLTVIRIVDEVFSPPS